MIILLVRRSKYPECLLASNVGRKSKIQISINGFLYKNLIFFWNSNTSCKFFDIHLSQLFYNFFNIFKLPKKNTKIINFIFGIIFGFIHVFFPPSPVLNISGALYRTHSLFSVAALNFVIFGTSICNYDIFGTNTLVNDLYKKISF